jgi:predicted transcriptional regulator
MKFDVLLFKKAGFNKNDIARLFGVSRTTVYNWHSEKTVHSLLKRKVEAITSAVRSALDDKALPIDVKSTNERAKEIQMVIKNYL